METKHRLTTQTYYTNLHSGKHYLEKPNLNDKSFHNP